MVRQLPGLDSLGQVLPGGDGLAEALLGPRQIALPPGLDSAIPRVGGVQLGLERLKSRAVDARLLIVAQSLAEYAESVVSVQMPRFEFEGMPVSRASRFEGLFLFVNLPQQIPGARLGGVQLQRFFGIAPCAVWVVQFQQYGGPAVPCACFPRRMPPW